MEHEKFPPELQRIETKLDEAMGRAISEAIYDMQTALDKVNLRLAKAEGLLRDCRDDMESRGASSMSNDITTFLNAEKTPYSIIRHNELLAAGEKLRLAAVVVLGTQEMQNVTRIGTVNAVTSLWSAIQIWKLHAANK